MIEITHMQAVYLCAIVFVFGGFLYMAIALQALNK